MDFDRVFYSLLRSEKGEELAREGDFLVSPSGANYPVENGIPRFTTDPDQGQAQVKETFAYKWTRNASWGIRDNTAHIMTDFIMETLGFAGEFEYSNFLSDKAIILDAGCGNGRETIRMARLNPEALVVGIDISEAIDAAAKNADGLKNVRFIQADIFNPPLATKSFDYILSHGVLHHTPNTKSAFSALAKLLAPTGEFAFYIYRKKAPIREFTDDYIRDQIRSMQLDDAWREMENYALLGKALSDLKVEIQVPELKMLGINAGRHNLQRLIYYTVLKCFWKDGWSLEENTHVNFDWFYPQYAWRHTQEEVHEWIKEASMIETEYVEIPAGMTFRVRHARSNI